MSSSNASLSIRVRRESISASYCRIFKFDDKFGLGFPLLADEGHEVAEAYGVWVEKSMYGRKYMGAERSTFVIDPEGRIKQVFRQVKPAEHDDLVLGALKTG